MDVLPMIGFVLIGVLLTRRWWRVFVPLAVSLFVGWLISSFFAGSSVWISYVLLLGAALGGGIWEYRHAVQVQRKSAHGECKQQAIASVPLPFAGVRRYVCPNCGEPATTLTPRRGQGRSKVDGWACATCGAPVRMAFGLKPFLGWLVLFLAVSVVLGYVAGPYGFSILVVPGLLLALWSSLQLQNEP